MKHIYYYKRENGDWVFSLPDSDGGRSTAVNDERSGNVFFRLLVKKVDAELHRLYLDIPQDFETIREKFFDREYWSNRTWQKEYKA